MAITTTQFGTLGDLFAYYNVELFEGKLPDILVNMSRHKGAEGFFAPNRWKSKFEKKLVHEISLNPDYMMQSDIRWHQTLVHEMAHHWQETFGKPSRTTYHNTEWANKMESIGLMPSHTGKEGGKKTGQKMSDYVIIGGEFEKAFNKISDADKEHLRLIYIPNIKAAYSEEVELTEEEKEELEKEKEKKKKKLKVKYTCGCGNNVWGKVGLNFTCDDCGKTYEEEEAGE